jgi:dolichyl-phosphate-mannose--protein O-mannosyl transferase
MLGFLGAFFGVPAGYSLKRMHRAHRNVLPWMAGVAAVVFVFGIALSTVLAGAVGYTAMLWIGLIFLFGSMWLWSEI